MPSLAEYCCMGEITTRLRMVMPRSVQGANSAGPCTVWSGARPKSGRCVVASFFIALRSQAAAFSLACSNAKLR